MSSRGGQASNHPTSRVTLDTPLKTPYDASRACRAKQSQFADPRLLPPPARGRACCVPGNDRELIVRNKANLQGEGSRRWAGGDYTGSRAKQSQLERSFKFEVSSVKLEGSSVESSDFTLDTPLKTPYDASRACRAKQSQLRAVGHAMESRTCPACGWAGSGERVSHATHAPALQPVPEPALCLSLDSDTDEDPACFPVVRQGRQRYNGIHAKGYGRGQSGSPAA